MTTPFCKVKNIYTPCPYSIIFILLSKYRKSNYSDKEIAEYISQGIAIILKSHKAKISISKDLDLLFVKEKDERRPIKLWVYCIASSIVTVSIYYILTSLSIL